MSVLDSELVSEVHHSPGVGVMVAIPTLGRNLCMDWAVAFKSINPPINYNMNMAIIPGMAVADARNKAVKLAIENKSQYLFFLGDDTIPPGDVLKLLIYRMEHDPSLGVVGGVYCAKSNPPYPLVFQEWGQGSDWNWKAGEYFPVKGMGMDCTLIRVSMLKEMQEPWFKTVDDDQAIDGINKAESWTEDLYFCEQVDKQVPHFKKYIDASILCGHYNHVANTIVTMPPDSAPMSNRPIKEEGTLRGLDIGGGYNPKKVAGFTMINFDKDGATNPDYRGDVRVLPFDSNSFDLVYSSHVLEHLPKKDTERAISEWLRVLKDKGIFVLKLPDVEWALDSMKTGKITDDVLNVLYGAQRTPYDYHYNGFTKDILEQMFTKTFKNLLVKKRDLYNLLLIGTNADNIDFEQVEKDIIDEV